MCGFFYHLHPKGRTKNIRSAIEAAKECTDPRAVYWREKIHKNFANSVFSRSGNTWEKIEKHKHKRGEYFECKLGPTPLLPWWVWRLVKETNLSSPNSREQSNKYATHRSHINHHHTRQPKPILSPCPPFVPLSLSTKLEKPQYTPNSKGDRNLWIVNPYPQLKGPGNLWIAFCGYRVRQSRA